MAKAKASNTATFNARARKKLRRHKKHQNKHKSSKPNVGQG